MSPYATAESSSGFLPAVAVVFCGAGGVILAGAAFFETLALDRAVPTRDERFNGWCGQAAVELGRHGSAANLLGHPPHRAAPDVGNRDQTTARKRVEAGRFDSGSLAEIVVKDGVRIPDGAQALSEFCTVVMQRPGSRERPATDQWGEGFALGAPSIRSREPGTSAGRPAINRRGLVDQEAVVPLSPRAHGRVVAHTHASTLHVIPISRSIAYHSRRNSIRAANSTPATAALAHSLSKVVLLSIVGSVYFFHRAETFTDGTTS